MSQLVGVSTRSGGAPGASPAISRAGAVGVELAVDLASALDTNDAYRRIPERAAQAADADRATLVRLDGDELIVEATYDREGRPDFPGLRTALQQQPACAAALETRQPVQGGALHTDAFPDEVRQALSSIRYSMVLPLEFGGEVLGFLQVLRRSGQPFDDAVAGMLGVIAAVAAVSLRNARLYADAQAARSSMSEFLDVVVHELRAPLTVATGYVSMMRESIFGEPPASWVRPLEMVDEKLMESQRLVDELLLAARLESGGLPFNIGEVDLADAAQRAAERAAPRAQLLDATLTAQTPDASVWASADVSHVDRILDNLVNNALTHGSGPAPVTVEAGFDGSPYLAVADGGPGIPEAERDLIFKRFFRGRVRDGGAGSGLGLYLSRQLAQSLDGSLQLDTEHHPGARFILRLPAAGPQAPAPA